MRFPRLVVVFLCVSWVVVALYPDPGTLVASVRNLLSPPVEPEAAAALAARLPDDPRLIERIVLDEVVPYASDWETEGVPWAFPTTAEVLRAGRGDCESRALVLASVLTAKGIPHELRMSLTHIWVDYPGKTPTASENDALVVAGHDGGGWFGLRWPDDLSVRDEIRAQLAMYWDPMPATRKALLLLGVGLIALWNPLAVVLSRPRGLCAAGYCALDAEEAPTPSRAGAPS